MKALIGITACIDNSNSRYFVSRGYINSVYKNGGIPIVLCPVHRKEIPDILRKIDGIILTGGGDVNPLILGEEPCNNIGEISPIRDKFEIALTRLALKQRIPILGICRGMQVMATSADGKILQDINSNICHMQKSPRYVKTHTVNIEKNSRLFSICGKKKIAVNSFHHQSVLECGKNFRPCAFSADGIIEAMENKKHSFAIGVQWHPETLFSSNKCENNIFTAFITEAEKARRFKNV
ncbi:MAG: gamma-glutamyl-gamma-aminobutyrate hydrolase family protein [Lachnospiraceae bacterium]|nr:gamma-glutamyl-gamma-aminobutyrate hydrolase family protein [Lachnospiraceae bacterium]